MEKNEQHITLDTFHAFLEGAELLSSYKKKGITLDGNAHFTINMVEEINELVTELLKFQKTITKFERGKDISLDAIIEETGDVWLTSAILVDMLSGSINDVLESANGKVSRTIRTELDNKEDKS